MGCFDVAGGNRSTVKMGCAKPTYQYPYDTNFSVAVYFRINIKIL